MLLCLGLSAGLSADEPLPTTDDDPPAAPRATKESEAIKEKEAVEPRPLDPLDQKLKKSLDPSESEEIERLEKAIAGMRAAGRRIEARDTGTETLRVQKQVLEDLNRLLELLKQMLQNQQNQKQNQGQKQDQNQQQNQSPDPRSGPQSANSSAPKVTPQEQESEAEKSREARERQEAARRGAGEDERQRMIKDVWGHLPPHLREAMLNSFSEKYLPKYEDLVKKYYEALAERNRNRSAK
jgi:hypothetical protein